MKQKTTQSNPYATLRGGKIEAPHKPKDEPKVSRKNGSDLRVKRS